jgi:hypothetical protein
MCELRLLERTEAVFPLDNVTACPLTTRGNGLICDTGAQGGIAFREQGVKGHHSTVNVVPDQSPHLQFK